MSTETSSRPGSQVDESQRDQSDWLTLLRQSFQSAVAAADPLQLLSNALPSPPTGRTLVVGAGKAAASMAAAVEAAWPQDKPLSGLVITRYAHGLPLSRIACIEAGHPVPDQAGEKAAASIFEQVGRLGPEDQLIVLVSGGGSSLLSLPVESVSMADLKRLTADLLRSGAPITDMNVVRKHLSRIQGGRLALASRAPVTALVISDVVGDDPSAIASGPCSADPSTYRDALDVLDRWEVEPPAAIRAHLRAGLDGQLEETPKPGDPRLSHVTTRLVATAQQSLRAAAAVFAEAGVRPIVLGDSVTGEARDVATGLASWVREIAQDRAEGFSRPIALISGGECTVTVRGAGRGGRCTEYLLSMALALEALAVGSQVYGVAADTDGIDGASEAAGALLTPTTLAQARALGLNPQRALHANDALSIFEPLGLSVVTGPTRTNVNDYRAILVL
ncbi:MAG: hydroxypyruvate reductase [Pseudomonadota bacterium]